MIETEEVPYCYSIDLSNIDISNDISINLIPVSVEVVPHKAYLIDSEQICTNSNDHSYLNFQIFRLSENRINRHRGNHQIFIQRIKCIFYTLISIPITIILLGYVSIALERA